MALNPFFVHFTWLPVYAPEILMYKKSLNCLYYLIDDNIKETHNTDILLNVKLSFAATRSFLSR